MINPDKQRELRERFNPDGSLLRKAQLRMLEMLKFIDQVCKDNNLTYWIDSGTLLGAARHGGFIPWDDDVDIAMPMEDAEKFKQIMIHNNPSDEFVIQCHETDPGYYGVWPVLRDLKSEYIQDSHMHNRRKYRGLQVDIFPMNQKINKYFHRIAGILINYFISDSLQNNPHIKIDTRYTCITKFILPLLKKLSFIKNKYFMMDYGVGFRTKRYLDNIYPLTTISFEGIELNAPSNTAEYLTDIYNKWQNIPDIDKIVTHKVDFKFI